jgi:small subunit ribosomal protein S6
MREYELMLVLDPEVDEDRLAAVMDRVRRIASSGGGEVIGEESWGKKRLAFKIGRHTEGHYHLATLRLETPATGEMENALNLAEDVMRHMLVRQEELAPATEELAPATEELAPATEELAPATEELAPATEELAPATE